jgi:hypothetical protein
MQKKANLQPAAAEQPNERQPYFARLLQKQELAQVAAGMTLKYPSDNDEEWPFP